MNTYKNSESLIDAFDLRSDDSTSLFRKINRIIEELEESKKKGYAPKPTLQESGPS